MRIFILLVFALLPLHTYGQVDKSGYFILNVLVKDESGLPVPNAFVKVGASEEVETNQQGRARIRLSGSFHKNVEVLIIVKIEGKIVKKINKIIETDTLDIDLMFVDQEAYETKINRLTNTNITLMEQLDALRNGASNETVILKDSIRYLKKLIKEKEKRLLILKRSINSINTSRVGLERQIAIRESEIQELREKLNSLQRKVEAKERMILKSYGLLDKSYQNQTDLIKESVEKDRYCDSMINKLKSIIIDLQQQVETQTQEISFGQKISINNKDNSYNFSITTPSNFEFNGSNYFEISFKLMKNSVLVGSDKIRISSGFKNSDDYNIELDDGLLYVKINKFSYLYSLLKKIRSKKYLCLAQIILGPDRVIKMNAVVFFRGNRNTLQLEPLL